MTVGTSARSNAETDRAESRRSPEFVEALARGLRVLHCFGEAVGGIRNGRLTLTEVATRTDLSRGTARRLLLTLRSLGYVASDGKHFWLTPQVLAFSNAFLGHLGFDETARPIIQALSKQLDESASVGVLDGGDIVYVARVDVSRLYASGIYIGTRLPAHCSALGRAMLATLSDDDLEDWLRRYELTPYTERTIADQRKWRQMIATVRKQGFAINDGEMELGLRSIAVPIVGRSGRTLGALNTSTSTARVSKEKLLGEYLPQVKAAAKRLAAVLDW